MISEEEKREATYNYLKSNFDYSRRRGKMIKRIILVFVIIIVVLASFLYFIGGIYIPGFAGYQRYYDVKLNDVQLSTLAYRSDKTIIKNLIYLHSSTGNSTTYFSTKAPQNTRKIADGRFFLSVQSYSCSYSNISVNCEDNKNYLKELKSDTKYKLRIYSHKNFEQLNVFGQLPADHENKDDSYDLLYENKFIEDITEYIKKEGQYIIEIEASYGFQTEKIMSVILNDGENITIF